MRVYALHRPPRRRRPRPQPGPPRIRQDRLASRRRPPHATSARLARVPPRPVEATANPTRRHPRPVRRHRNHRPGCESPRPPRHHRRPVRRLLPHRHLAHQRPRPAGQGHAGTPPTGPGRRAARPVRRTWRCAMSIRQPWRWSYRADARALPLADRHYTRQKPGSAQFVPPGRCVVLLTDDADALWVTSWPFPEFVRHAWAGSMLCTLFRRDPGCCFRRAGWTPVGHTASGLVALQLRPADFPAPLPARPRYAHGQGDLFDEADLATAPWPRQDPSAYADHQVCAFRADATTPIVADTRPTTPTTGVVRSGGSAC